MSTIDNDNVRKLIETLDVLIPREAARIRLDQLNMNAKGGVFVGNKNGYLRLGIEFLKAGIAEQQHLMVGPRPAHMEWKYLVSQKSIVFGFDEFLRDNALEADPTFADPMSFSIKDKCRVAKLGLLFFGVAVFAIIGVVSVFRWLFSLFS